MVERAKNSATPLNVASLPKHEALSLARDAGRGVLADSEAVSSVCLPLWIHWMNANIPTACGQSDDEFGELIAAMMEQFEFGVDEFVESASSAHEEPAAPSPLEGELAAEGALLLVNAIKWMNNAAQDDSGIAAFQTILDVALPELDSRIEKARWAVSACR
jgi:hypothetical protein